MDDRAEVHGSKGVAYADLLHGNAIETYSATGYDYAVEKAGSTKGWTFTMLRGDWNYGFPQEMAAFRRLRPERQTAARDRRRRPGGAGDHVRRLRIRRLGPQGRAAVLEKSEEAVRFVEEALGAAGKRTLAWPGLIIAGIIRT